MLEVMNSNEQVTSLAKFWSIFWWYSGKIVCTYLDRNAGGLQSSRNIAREDENNYDRSSAWLVIVNKGCQKDENKYKQNE